jgi:hypothetical protein
MQLLQALTRIVVIPSRGVEGMTGERLHARDSGKFGFRQGPVGADHESRAHVIAAVGSQMPQLLILVPDRGADCGAEHGLLVKAVPSRNRLAMRVDLRAPRVLPVGHVLHLVQQGQVVIRQDVAGYSGVPIPIPGATDVAATFDDSNALNPLVAQPRRCQQGGEAAADEQHLDLVIDRLARILSF